MKGKDKCKILKEIRAQIAAANDIAWVTENCTHKGDCRGTCPKCEAEVLTLERELARRRALGKRIAVVGLSAGIITTATACSDPTPLRHTASAEQETQEPTDIVVENTGDLVFAGAPLPPETTEAFDGEMVEMGEPLPVYYLTDFTLYDGNRLFIANQPVYLDEVIEENEAGEEISNIEAGEDFLVIGDNGSEYTEAYMFLVRYKGKLYAVDKYYLDNCATEYVPVDE